jgi:hypothetical protein
VAAPSFSRTQFVNLLAYHTLVSLVNLLNLPLPHGSFFPRRADDLTLLDRDVARLRMLKAELDAGDPAAVRGFLIGAKALLFELEFLLHQERGLQRNEAFFADLERLGNLLAQADTLADAAHLRNLAYKLVIRLPFYDDRARADERNATAERWFAGVERPLR